MRERWEAEGAPGRVVVMEEGITPAFPEIPLVAAAAMVRFNISSSAVFLRVSISFAFDMRRSYTEEEEEEKGAFTPGTCMGEEEEGEPLLLPPLRAPPTPTPTPTPPPPPPPPAAEVV